MFERLKNLKGELKKIIKNNREILVENELKMVARNGSGFDVWIILNIVPECCKIVKMIKTGKGIISLKIHNGNVDI